MTYQEQLQDPRWIRKRSRILQRDWNMCQTCMGSVGLHVHHKKYINDKMAWDYPDFMLITLCSNCHKEEHGISQEEERIPLLFGKIRRAVSAWTGLALSELKKNG